MKRNKQMKHRTFPKKRKHRIKRSVPLKRSVHIGGLRWGWEYEVNKTVGCGLPLSHCKTCDEGCRENEKIKIISPDNKYYEIGVESFTEDFKVPNYAAAKFEVTESGEMERHIPEETIALRRIRPGFVKQYILDNLILERSVAKAG